MDVQQSQIIVSVPPPPKQPLEVAVGPVIRRDREHAKERTASYNP